MSLKKKKKMKFKLLRIKLNYTYKMMVQPCSRGFK